MSNTGLVLLLCVAACVVVGHAGLHAEDVRAIVNEHLNRVAERERTQLHALCTEELRAALASHDRVAALFDAAEGRLRAKLNDRVEVLLADGRARLDRLLSDAVSLSGVTAAAERLARARLETLAAKTQARVDAAHTLSTLACTLVVGFFMTLMFCLFNGWAVVVGGRE